MSIQQQCRNFFHAISRLGKFFLNNLSRAFTLALFFCSFASAQTLLVDPAGNGGFESGTTFPANGWTSVNGLSNKWYIGTAATGYSGANGAFIGTSSSTYAYTSNSAHSHLYRDINIPANQPNLTITFRIKCTGNSNANLSVYLAPTTYTPVSTSQPSLTYLIGQSSYYGYTNYTSVTINVNCTITGDRRLIFSWNNGTAVNNPPAAIDDISVVCGGCSSFSGTGYNLVSALPYASTGRNLCGKVNDFTSGNTIICGSGSYLGAEDEIFEFKPTSSGIVTATISNTSALTSAIMLYKGCPSGAACSNGVCLAYNQNTTTNKSLCASVAQDSSYFLLVDGASDCYTYNINISVAATVPNDLPCSATPLTLGTKVDDNNSCAQGNNEPSTPSCWTAGVVNSLWYSFVAPPSGEVHLGIGTGSLITSQIQLFSGPCGSLTSVSNSCVDFNTMRCPGAMYTGLTPGATYYIRLDGYNNDVGSYTIVVDDNAETLTPLRQDCDGAVEICSTFYNSINNPMGCGNVPDIAPSTYSNPGINPNCCNNGCLLVGEINPGWYRFTITTSGTLNWTLSCSAAAYFDWELWNATNTSCSAIHNNELAPIRCNWNGTAVGSTGMENPAPGGFTVNFEFPLSVIAGETYILCITNFGSVTTPYTLDFSNSTCTIGSPTPANAMISADGPTTFCSGENVVLSAATSGFSYQWKKNGADVSGATLQSYTVKKTGDYKCTVSTSCGSTTSNTIHITVNPKPVVSISSAPCSGSAVLLTCTSDPGTGVKYKWKKDGVIISGATNPTYSAATNGNYKCTITITATGCKKTTPELSVVITCKLDQTEEIPVVTVYPNPSSGAFTFSTSVFNDDGEVLICDITGKLMESHPFFGNDVTAGENLPDGIYLAKIRLDGELMQVMKLIKTR